MPFFDIVTPQAMLIIAIAGFGMGKIFFSRFANIDLAGQLWGRFIAGLGFFSFMFFDRLAESPSTAYRWWGGLILWFIFIVFLYLGEKRPREDRGR